jgi:diguanylate cyclase (GGDEF)-like protein
VDITSRKHAEQELADNNHRSEVITSMLDETIWTYDLKSGVLRREGNLDWTYSPESVLKGQFSDDAIKNLMHPDDTERFLSMRDSWLQKLGKQREIFRIMNRTGAYRRVEILTSTETRDSGKPEVVYGLTRLLPEEEKGTASTVETVTDEDKTVNKINSKLTKIAGTAQATAEDTITGLLPYAGFLRKAERVLGERRDGDQYALVCADINEFRSFSHHYGFYISNRILKAFSDVLLKYLAKDGMCARVDGDYFVVLFQYSSHKELVKAMSSVVRHQQDMELDEGNIEFGSTTGVYLVQDEDHELMDMLEKADLARRSIKGLKGNHYAIYTEEVAQQLSQEDEMVEDVRNAMVNHGVEINYLPRICNVKENVVGCKAIPRILTKDGQYVEYIQIMHLMERGAQLEEFSFYLLQEVANNIGAYQAKGNRVIPVAVEMTASQLSTGNAVERIHDMVVTQNNLNPHDFIFEIPERFFVDATTAFEMAIRRLHQLGYQIVISRFASDHTAINSIRRLPVTGIKFHGEYFQEHMINEKDSVILKKVVEMAEELGLSVTCGGIHTKLQEDFAKKIGCKMFEGDMYYGVMKNVVFERCFLN